jgi:hypothetical protein
MSVALTLLPLAIGPSSAAAQAAHYWSSHFGNESILLNGAVIGSVTDPGAIFYNPARLLHQEAPALVSSAKVYELISLDVPEWAGKDGGVSRSRFGGAPGFVVGTFTIPRLEGHQFAYGILTRYRSNLGVSIPRDQDDAFEEVPGSTLVVGNVDLSIDNRDQWTGVSWAYALDERWSIGASAFYYARSMARRATLDFRGVDDAGGAAAYQVARSYSVSDKGLVTKLGAAWRSETLSAGMSVTLPYWSVVSKGSVRFDDFSVGVPDSTGATEPALRSLTQSRLPVEWKTPWSVGAGGGWTVAGWQFHAAAEYFFPVAAHVLVHAGPDGELSNGAPVEYTVTEERRAVLNVGAGVRWNISEDVSAFASLATNHSAAPDSVVEFTRLAPMVSHTSTQADLFLYGGGVSVHTRWVDLTLGAAHQGAREQTPRLISARTASEGDFTVARFSQWRFLAGFSVPFIDERLGRGRRRQAPAASGGRASAP